MKKNDSRQSKRKRSQKAFPPQIIAVIVVIAVAALFFLWHQKNVREDSVNTPLLQQSENQEISVPAPPNEKETVSAQQTQSSQSEKSTAPGYSGTQSDTAPPSASDLGSIDEQPAPPEPVNTSGQSTAGSNNGQAGNGSTPDSTDGSAKNVSKSQKKTPLSLICSKSARTIKEFYLHLDEQPYVKTYDISPDSEVYFTKLIQRLLDNPPVVSGETDDLYTILQNTAHFFRVIGKDNILLLKAILDMEKDQFEDVLSDFYTLINIPACPEKSFGLRVSDDALYNYAGFFLNTMGGRLYLFRRDSKSRMVVSYYSILLIDKANKNASNRHGIELRTPIDQLISEMESTANTLQLKDMYLDKLYDLKEEYQ